MHQFIRSTSNLILTTGFLSGYAYAATPAAPEVTYHNDVAPILAAHCVECHNPEGIGPFSLLNYSQVRRRAQQIFEVTESGYMPPWKPESGAGPALIGERRLSDAQKRTLGHWFKTGTTPGDSIHASTYSPPSSAWRLGEPDLILILPHAYELPAQGKDVYRNLILPFPLSDRRFVKAVDIRPGNRQAVHHALLMVDQTGRAIQRDREETGVGYDGMGVGSGTPPSGHIIGWTPGQDPHEVYPGTAWELSPDTDLVLQLHLLPTGKPELVRPQIGLYFTDTPPSLSSFIIQLRNFDIDIPAGDSNYRVQESISLPVPVKVIGLYPHAHYIAKDLKIFATLPDSPDQGLLRIPDWDFNWQGDYRFVKPVELPAGATLHMDYRYDNSADNPRNPSSPAIAVRGGWSSLDEMGEAMIQVVPKHPEDLPRLREAQLAYDVAQSGGEARYHYFNGIYLEQQGEFAQAFAAYSTALELDPSFASTHYKLGTLWEQRGESQRAFSYYESALQIQPKLISARLAIAKLLMQQRRFANAQEIIQSVHNENPQHLLATLYLARFHLATGDGLAALTLFETNLSRFADAPQFRLEFGEALWHAGKIAAAKKQLTAATSVRPTSLDVGATAALQTIRASAYYMVALIHRDEGNLHYARQSLTDCLNAAPFHLDALLLAANLAIQADDEAVALTYLQTLISLPKDATFSDEDILANLPRPAGARLLDEARQAP